MSLYIYILGFRNTKSHLLQVYLGAWVKIEIVIEHHVHYTVGHCYNSFQALFKYKMFSTGYMLIRSNFETRFTLGPHYNSFLWSRLCIRLRAYPNMHVTLYNVLVYRMCSIHNRQLISPGLKPWSLFSIDWQRRIYSLVLFRRSLSPFIDTRAPL